jgi:signal transduction histidine kinase
MKQFQILVLASAVACGCGPSFAATRATKDQAVAMVKKAVAAIKAQGAATVYKEITGKDPAFRQADLYIVVYGLDGTVLAHGANAKLVGKNLIGVSDVDGKPFVKERVDLAKKQPSFWQSYKFVDPTTKKIEPKEMYCERLDQTAVCGGVYKP